MSSDNHAGPRKSGAHPSYAWDPAVYAGPAVVKDRPAFARAMDNPRYPRTSRWSPDWVFHNSMGPINLWCAEVLTARLALQPGSRILDLGCGAASTSIFLAEEFGVEVWAADLWVDPEDNRRRIAEAGLTDRVVPYRAEAHALPFERDFFDAVVSIDAYHYFGTEVRYLSYLAQFVRPGGAIGIVVPGNAVDPDDPGALSLDPALADELGADWFTFRSADWWRRHWSRTRCVEVEFSGMVEQGSDDWRRWIAATRAAYGPYPRIELNARMVDSAAGGSLGFCLATARRNRGPTISFGTEGFAAEG